MRLKVGLKMGLILGLILGLKNEIFRHITHTFSVRKGI